MKKNLNFLLILSIVCFAITQVLCFSAIIFDEFNLFPITSEVVDNVNNAGNNPGVGEYLIIAGGLGLIADFSLAFLLGIMLIFVPAFLNGIIVIVQGLSRIFQIGIEKDWKNIVSKILTVVSIILQVLLNINLFMVLISNFLVSKIILFVALGINIVCLVLFIKEFIKMTKYKNS